MRNKKAKALVLLSGGLDSILAVKILMEQGIKVTGLTFKSYFFDAEQAKKAAKELGVKLKIVDFSKEHLKMIKSPKYGYGKSMNPCIDCHILMLKMAKRIMIKEKFDFVATGEVLGERPMSQNKTALDIIEKESSLTGYLLRPLSAKLLKKTIPEEKGLVEREKSRTRAELSTRLIPYRNKVSGTGLLNISGRSRKRQIELTKKWGIKEYPTPAGGCLLTDLEFGKRIKELFEKYPSCKDSDILLLKYGRHFWSFDLAQDKPFDSAQGKSEIKIIVGRNEEENKKIKKLIQRGDTLIEMKNYPGPLTLVRNYGKKKISPQILKKAEDLNKYYSTKARNKKDVKFLTKTIL